MLQEYHIFAKIPPPPKKTNAVTHTPASFNITGKKHANIIKQMPPMQSKWFAIS